MGEVTPELSIVIPTFNRAAVLGRAVESVLRQAPPTVEVVVVDDGSTDRTADVLNQTGDSRLVVVRQDNRGVSAARNAGVRAARASFVTFLDSDDEALEGWVEYYLVAARAAADLASCGIRFVHEDKRTVDTLPRDGGPEFGHLRSTFLAGAYGLQTSLFWQAGGFLEGLRYGENHELGFRLGGLQLQKPLRTMSTDQVLVVSHRSSSRYDPERSHSSAAQILANAGAHLERSPTGYATYLAIAGVGAARIGRHREGVTYLWRAIRVHPAAWRNYARLARALLGLVSFERTRRKRA